MPLIPCSPWNTSVTMAYTTPITAPTAAPASTASHRFCCSRATQ